MERYDSHNQVTEISITNTGTKFCAFYFGVDVEAMKTKEVGWQNMKYDNQCYYDFGC